MDLPSFALKSSVIRKSSYVVSDRYTKPSCLINAIDPDQELALVFANNEEAEYIALFSCQRFVKEISGIVWSKSHNKAVAEGAIQVLRGSPIANVLPAIGGRRLS